MQTETKLNQLVIREPVKRNRVLVIDSRGFTLVELVFVLVIIMILSVVGFTGMINFKEAARTSRCMSEIRSMEREVAAWSIDKAALPASLGDIGRTSLRDPWGREYVYSVPTREFVGSPINEDYDLYSKGPDGLTVDSIDAPGGEDDIIRGRSGLYVGPALKYL